MAKNTIMKNEKLLKLFVNGNRSTDEVVEFCEVRNDSETTRKYYTTN